MNDPAHFGNKQYPEAILLDKMLRYVSAQERCTFDIQKKLKTYQASPETIQRILEKLLHANYVNDDRFLKMYTDSATKYKKKGAKWILFQLRRKGFKEAEILPYIKEIDGDLVSENIQKLIERKLRQLVKCETSWEKKQKLVAFLMQRGYEYDVIKKSIEQLKI